MLTRGALADLVRSHQDDWVLSVYIGKDGSDPGTRGAWRLRLEAALEAVAGELDPANAEGAASFRGARERIDAAVAGFGRVLPHEGWAAFATDTELVHFEGLPFAPTDLVRWNEGIYTAPYVRALKGRRPVILVLMDGWHARLFRYLEGALSPVLELGADRSAIDASDVGMSKRPATTTGVRGLTRTDYAQRMLDEESKRLRKQSVEAIVDMAGDGGGVVIGGTAKAVAAAKADLEQKLDVVEVSELSFASTEAQIAEAAATAASELTRARQDRLLRICAESNRGSVGWEPTYKALESGAVDTLLVARPLIESSPDEAERIVRMALAQGAEIEELGDDVGTRLWTDADGVAARLRFNVAA